MVTRLLKNVIPDTLPVTGGDRFCYALKTQGCNIQIQAVISFNKNHLNPAILARAVRLTLDAEPVLGCRFVEDERQPYWQRFEQLDSLPWFEFVQSENKTDKEEAVEQFMKSPFASEGQQLNVRLMRTPGADVLGVKICHACSDAGGLKQYLALLAGIYSKLLMNPGFEPDPNIEGRRDLKYYFEALGIDDPLSLYDPQNQPPAPTWAFPYQSIECREMRIAARRLSGNAFEKIIAFGKTYEVTVNSILMTAFARTMFRLAPPPVDEEMGIGTTIDLRQAFSRNSNQSISNLSVGMEARIARVENESFNETLKRVLSSISALRFARADLCNAVNMELMGTIEYSKLAIFMQTMWQESVATGKCDPALSNMGIISPLRFGEITAGDAYLVTPAVAAPGILLGASTYNQILTLAVCYYEPAHKKEEVEGCLDLMVKELGSLEV